MNTTFNNNMITLRKNMNCDYALGSACGFRRLRLMLLDETICFIIMVVKSISQNIDKNNITVKIVLKTGLLIELIRPKTHVTQFIVVFFRSGSFKI